MRSLPRGRHGLSREFIADHQRARLFSAVATVLDRNGYEGATVAAVAGEAGVSKSDFYAQFETKEDCFGAAYDAAVALLRTEVLAARVAREDWAGGVCTGLAAALGWLASDPPQANLLLVEGLRAGADVCGRYRVAVDSFVPCLRDGAPAVAIADEAVVGGIASLLGRRVLAGDAALLDRFFPELAEFVLTPYLGIAEARRIISAR